MNHTWIALDKMSVSDYDHLYKIKKSDITINDLVFLLYRKKKKKTKKVQRIEKSEELNLLKYGFGYTTGYVDIIS